MNEERRQVLEMLAAGRITVEQAGQLLEALGAEHRSGQADNRPAMEPERRRSQASQRVVAPERDLLVALAAVVDAAGIRALYESGLIDEIPYDLLMSLAPIADVAYIRELRDSGVIDLVPRDLLVALVPIAAVARIRELYDAGLLTDVPRDTLLSLVPVADVAYIRELRDLGLIAPSSDRTSDARMVGVGANIVDEARE